MRFFAFSQVWLNLWVLFTPQTGYMLNTMASYFLDETAGPVLIDQTD
jgi:hypothetical protein